MLSGMGSMSPATTPRAAQRRRSSASAGRGRSPRRPPVTLLTVLATCVLVAGCSLLDGPTPLERAADEASTWPIVTYVRYYEATIADDEELYITIRSDAPAEEFHRLWCEVLAPGGADYTNTGIDGGGYAPTEDPCPSWFPSTQPSGG